MNEHKLQSSWKAFVYARGLFSAQLAPDKGFFPLAALAVLGIAASNTVLLSLLGKPVDLIVSGNYAALVSVLLWLAFWVVINQLFHFSTTILLARLGLRFVGRVRQRLVSHLLYISWPAAGRFSQGDVLARLTNDSDEVQRLLVESPFYFFSHLCIIGFYLLMLFWLDVRLALIALAISPLFIVHQRLFVGPRRRVSMRFMQTNGVLLEFEQSVVRFIKHIAALRADRYLAGQHRKVFADAVAWAMKDRWLEALFRTSLLVLVYLAALMILYLGIARVQAGILSVGELISFLLFLGYLSMPLRELVQISFQVQSGITAVSRIDEILQIEPPVPHGVQPEQWRDNSKGVSIQLRDVTFAYDQQAPLFSNVSFDIEAGEAIALVGRSGSGKSSFVNLLMHFNQPGHGRILLNGIDMQSIPIIELRRHISVVWQQPALFPGSLRENLLLANSSATELELFKVCQEVGLEDWISQQPSGLDVTLGGEGVELSGGQMQRLAIAQALLQDAPLLILDEPTSALDSQSEQAIVELIDKVRPGRTILMVGHRFSSLRHLDRVMFFYDGLIRLDTHENLMSDVPAYREAIRWQTDIPG